MKSIIKYFSEIWNTNRAFRDLLIIILVCILTYLFFVLSDSISILEQILKPLEDRQDSAIFFILIVISVGLIVFSYRRYTELRTETQGKKITELKMQRNRAQLQAVLDGVPDMIVQVDNNARILWANKEALSKNPNAIGKSFDFAFSILDEPFIDYYCMLAIETGKIEKGIKFQPAMYGVEGDSYWEGIGVPLKSSDGSVFGAIAIARNVSERLRIEHTWNLLASIVESTEDAIYGMAFGGTILTWNLGAEKIYGYSASELVGTSIFKILPIEERDKLLQIIDKVIRKQQIERFESIRIRKDGKRIFVSVNICPFVDATGKKIGVSAIDRDITESKLAEDTLRNSESRFRTLFSTAPDGIVLMDVSGSILEINPAITTLYEYHRDELLGKSFLKFIKPNDIEKIQLQIHSILHKYDIRINNEATIITSSGKSIPVGISMASLRNENLQPTGLI
ncbi:MAG: PAS domain S-box protein, partial [Bacteroidota bacterium]